MVRGRKERKERFAAADVAGERESAESGAVIALRAGDKFGAGGFAVFEKKLAAELEGGFGGFGASGGEEDAAGAVGGFVKIAGSESEKAASEFGGSVIGELRRVDVSEGTGLSGDGLGDGRDSVADGDDGGTAGGVENFATVGGEDEGAFGADSFGISLAEAARKKRGGGI